MKQEFLNTHNSKILWDALSPKITPTMNGIGYVDDISKVKGFYRYPVVRAFVEHGQNYDHALCEYLHVKVSPDVCITIRREIHMESYQEMQDDGDMGTWKYRYFYTYAEGPTNNLDPFIAFLRWFGNNNSEQFSAQILHEESISSEVVDYYSRTWVDKAGHLVLTLSCKNFPYSPKISMFMASYSRAINLQKSFQKTFYQAQVWKRMCTETHLEPLGEEFISGFNTLIRNNLNLGEINNEVLRNDKEFGFQVAYGWGEKFSHELFVMIKKIIQYPEPFETFPETNPENLELWFNAMYHIYRFLIDNKRSFRV